MNNMYIADTFWKIKVVVENFGIMKKSYFRRIKSNIKGRY